MSEEEVVEAPENVAEIVITIGETNASYSSTLPPHEIVFWLELMKSMIMNGFVESANTPSPTA